MKTKLAVLTILLIVNGCFTDTEDVVSFEVNNLLNEEVELTFIDYQTDHERNYMKVDTSFTIDKESQMLIYYMAGRVLNEERYRNDTALVWFDSLIVKKASSGATSQKEFTNVNEWTVFNGKHHVVYNLSINEDDF